MILQASKVPWEHTPRKSIFQGETQIPTYYGAKDPLSTLAQGVLRWSMGVPRALPLPLVCGRGDRAAYVCRDRTPVLDNRDRVCEVI